MLICHNGTFISAIVITHITNQAFMPYHYLKIMNSNISIYNPLLHCRNNHSCFPIQFILFKEMIEQYFIQNISIYRIAVACEEPIQTYGRAYSVQQSVDYISRILYDYYNAYVYITRHFTNTLCLLCLKLSSCILYASISSFHVAYTVFIRVGYNFF